MRVQALHDAIANSGGLCASCWPKASRDLGYPTVGTSEQDDHAASLKLGTLNCTTNNKLMLTSCPLGAQCRIR